MHLKVIHTFMLLIVFWNVLNFMQFASIGGLVYSPLLAIIIIYSPPFAANKGWVDS